MQILNIEILVSVLARGVFGVFFAAMFSFIFWRLTSALVDIYNLGTTLYFLAQASIVGVPAAVGIAMAWWNTQSSGRVLWLAVVLTLGTAVAGAWLVNEIRGVETHYALAQGVVRVQVLSVGHMLSSMMAGAVFIGNAIAATFYVYRALRHREM